MKTSILRRFVASAASVLMVAVMLSVATYPARADHGPVASVHSSISANSPL